MIDKIFPLKGFVLKRISNYHKPNSFGRYFDSVNRKLTLELWEFLKLWVLKYIGMVVKPWTLTPRYKIEPSCGWEGTLGRRGRVNADNEQQLNLVTYMAITRLSALPPYDFQLSFAAFMKFRFSSDYIFFAINVYWATNWNV